MTRNLPSYIRKNELSNNLSRMNMSLSSVIMRNARVTHAKSGAFVRVWDCDTKRFLSSITKIRISLAHIHLTT